MSLRPDRARDERGAVLLIMTVFIVVLLLIVAIVIDLGATRSDRRGGQLAVDNAASSAAQTLLESDIVEACENAVDTVQATLTGATFAGGDCASLDPCGGPSPQIFTAALGDATYTLRIHHPVANASPLMARPSTINGQAVTPRGDEGTPCSRIGVELHTSGEPFFGQIAGSTERPSTVHAVARVTAGTTELRPLNLLSLDRTACSVMTVSGEAEIVVAGALDPATGRYTQGTAASDSDASLSSGPSNCNSQSAATTVVNGTGARILANGPCATNPANQCDGTGQVLLHAASSDGLSCSGTSDAPACREAGGATIDPDADSLSQRFTRAPVDYRFNCKTTYASELWSLPPLAQDIPGCPTAGPNTAYVDGLKTFVASAMVSTPSTFQRIGGPRPQDCRFDATTPIPAGNVYVDCSTTDINGDVAFTNGNVIFRGGVTVASGATLVLHSCASTCTDTMSWTPGGNYDERQSSPDAAWAYVGGELRLASRTSNITINRASVFIGPLGRLRTTGGQINWTAPRGNTPFRHLAMWSEGTDDHTITGNGAVDMVGVFFNGRSTFEFTGGGNEVLDEAQFVANRLRFTGQGRILLSPDPNDAVAFPIPGSFGMIR